MCQTGGVSYETKSITTIAADAVSDEIDVTNLVDKWVAVSGLTGGTANVQIDDLEGNLVTIGSLEAPGWLEVPQPCTKIAILGDTMTGTVVANIRASNPVRL